jgi:hypothetical protein
VREASYWAATLLLALWGVGCGSGDALDRASGPRMAPGAASQAETAEPAAANRPPVIDSVHFQPARPGAGQLLRAVPEASDPDGDSIRFEYRWRVNSQELAQVEEKVALPDTRKGDLVRVAITASDGREKSAPFGASVRIGNRAPKLAGLRVEPVGRISAGEEVRARAEASDPDGDPISFDYTWSVNGKEVAEGGPVFSTRGLDHGDKLRVRVVASDGQDSSKPIQGPEIAVGNGAPIILSQAGPQGPDGVFRYRVRAEDPDGDLDLHFSLLAAPEGMTVAPTRGEIEWAPRPDQAGRHPVEILVEDLQGGRATQSFELRVGAAGSEAAPPASPLD